MPIEPVDPSKKTGGDGQEKYPAKPKHGPGKFDEDLEKAKSDRAKAEVSRIAEEQKSKKQRLKLRAHVLIPKDFKIWVDYLNLVAQLGQKLSLKKA
jgi:hypothetical protein